MKIHYEGQDDILTMEFSKSPIVRDVSHGWHISMGYSTQGLAEITILDAMANGYWPLENAKDLLKIST